MRLRSELYVVMVYNQCQRKEDKGMHIISMKLRVARHCGCQCNRRTQVCWLYRHYTLPGFQFWTSIWTQKRTRRSTCTVSTSIIYLIQWICSRSVANSIRFFWSLNFSQHGDRKSIFERRSRYWYVATRPGPLFGPRNGTKKKPLPALVSETLI